MADASVPHSAMEAMAMFPLPGIVLFPGALLPLHIFEPRYRKMVADCIAGDGCMAMTFQLGERDDLDGPPPVAPLAGVGRIVHHEALADGRSNIVLQGCARAHLEELPFVAPYRRARARLVADIATPVAAVDRAALLATAIQVAAVARIGDFELPPALDPGAMADLCAHRLLAQPPIRQRILEMTDVRQRVLAVTALLADLLSREPRKDRDRRAKPD
jgi:ATP-dependent Lon protease